MGLVCNLHELLTTIQDVQEQSVIICQTLIDYRLAMLLFAIILYYLCGHSGLFCWLLNTEQFVWTLGGDGLIFISTSTFSSVFQFFFDCVKKL